MSLTIWIAILSVIVLSGIIKGTTGFGFALFSLPLLIHFIPVKNLVPIITMFNIFTSLLIIVQSKGFKIKKSIFLLSLTGSMGVILGTFVLKYLPETFLKLIASVTFIIISILFLSGYHFKIRKLRRGNAMAGIFSGFLGGSLSVSGPPLALFLTSLKIDSENFRNTFAWFSIFTSTIAFCDYIKLGFVNQDSWLIFIIAVPLLLISTWIGKILNSRIPVQAFYKVVITITLISGIFLFYDTIKDKSLEISGINKSNLISVFHRNAK